MFGQVGWGEFMVLLVVGLFVFGPERLPKVAQDAARVIKQLRQMAQGVTEDIRSELGPEFDDLDLRSLHPRTFVEKHLFGDDEPAPGSRQSFETPSLDESLSLKKSFREPPVSFDKPVGNGNHRIAAESRQLPTGADTPYDEDAT